MALTAEEKQEIIAKYATHEGDTGSPEVPVSYTHLEQALRVLVPGANIVVATNPLVSHLVAGALESAGLEPRGQLVRLVQTMRGGDRPKGFESEYPDVSVMPRSQFEPWVIMRKPMDETTGRNLAEYGTGGWRRIDDDHPFGDVIKSAPTRKEERAIANHPSLKPQKLMRQIVRAALPLGMGMILDPFAGSGSTLAAAESLGYSSLGIDVYKRQQDFASKRASSLPWTRRCSSTSAISSFVHIIIPLDQLICLTCCDHMDPSSRLQSTPNPRLKSHDNVKINTLS